MAVNAWLTYIPTYKAVVAPVEASYVRRRSGSLERQNVPVLDGNKACILSIVCRNIMYKVAVMYVFVVTLVCVSPCLSSPLLRAPD